MKNNKSKKYLLSSFLKSKGVTFNKCSKRQKDILLKEKPNMWNFYIWII